MKKKSGTLLKMALVPSLFLFIYYALLRLFGHIVILAYGENLYRIARYYMHDWAFAWLIILIVMLIVTFLLFVFHTKRALYTLMVISGSLLLYFWEYDFLFNPY